MPETTMKKIKRSEFAAFLNTTPGEAATYSRMGKGITGQTISYNPTTTSETYIHEDAATTSVDSFAPSINTPQTCYAGEPVFEYIDGLRRSRAVGADVETDILLVYLYSNEGSNAFAAEKCKCVIAVEEFGGDGGATTSITYTISLNGDPEIGTATIADGTVSFAAE